MASPPTQDVVASERHVSRFSAGDDEIVNEQKVALNDDSVPKTGEKSEFEITSAPVDDTDAPEKGDVEGEVIIITGADAAHHLLPLRDDFDPVITFRSLLLATLLSGFQAVMQQIYVFKPTSVTLSGTFTVLIAYFAGNAWATFLPRGDKLEARWRARGGQGEVPRYIWLASQINHGPWSLKEHAIAALTATSSSNAGASIEVFAAQDLFYDLPLSMVTVVLSIISIGLFGYGLCGIFRPITVWHVDAVYWSTLPVVKTLQGLHWQEVKSSKPLRVFWYAFAGMAAYEFFPAYIFPWLNSVSVPCLAAMNATGSKAAVLKNLFGGSINNEGLGMFSLSFDWQYITSMNTSLPLTLQLHSSIGYLICMIVMLAIYYSNTWSAKSQPFMSTRLRAEDGTVYPSAKVFAGGVLDKAAFAQYGVPMLTGTFAYAMFMANAAIGALVAHCVVFWGGDIVRTFKSARKGVFNDPHHQHMVKHYKDVPHWWYISVLVLSFILGLVVVIKENITLPAWGYVVSILLGILIAPFSTILYSRFGNGIATNNLSKMIAGLLLPERPVGNMYFAAWSHNVIVNTVNLSNDLKMGEYLKIPPRAMFITQIYGTVLGGFVNYAVMRAIVNGNRELLVNSDGNSSWSGATIQSYNTNATSWALAKYLYKSGTRYEAIPFGLLVGASIVVVHRIFAHFVPKIKRFSIYDLNMPQLIQYAGYIPYNASQTCVLLSQVLSGLFVQYYLRNHRPRIFKDYSYLVTGAFDGASLTVLFILSFAVFGAGGRTVHFPKWWGNNADGLYDHCPSPE